MAIMIETPAELYSPEKAEQMANELNADEYDDWTYKAVHCPNGTGYSFVAIYDESGELIGKL